MTAKNKKFICMIALSLAAMFVFASCGGETKINVFDNSYTSEQTENGAAETTAIPVTTAAETLETTPVSERTGKFTAPDFSSGERQGISSIVDEIKPSVVAINVTGTITDYFFGSYPTEGSGSGVIISEDGYIVTNNHVISGGETITVFLNDGEKCAAELIGSDEKTDLAVIKIDRTGLSPAVLGNSSTLRVGDYAIAIGNPTGELQGTVTLGIISALDREMVIDGERMTMLQTDAAVSPGNSGGGLFDTNGTLIGIVTAKSVESNVEGLGFVIPVDYVIPVINDLIEYGYVRGRPTLGFETVDITSRQSMIRNGLDWMGVYINKVYAGSSAESAGLKFKDYIKSADGEELTSGDRLTEIMNNKKVGDIIVLEIWRGDDVFDIVLTIDEEKGNN